MKRHHLILFFLLFLALAFVLTWPLPLYLTTHAPGDGSDDPAMLWNLWWIRHSLTDLGQNPFESAWMFWPIGINLVFYTLTTLNGLLSIPIQLAFGIVPANSFIVYFELTIAAFGMWLFVRWVFSHHLDAAPFSYTTRDMMALLAGIVYAFSTSKWLYLSLGQFNIASSHWLPWAVLYLSRMWTATAEEEGDKGVPSQAQTWRGWRDTALCALFVLFTGWTEFTYASFFIQLAFLLWLWLMLAGWKNQQWARMKQYTQYCAGLGGLFLFGMSPVFWLMWQDMQLDGDFLVQGEGFANVFSNDLLGFFVPSHLHPIFGELVENGFSFAYLNFAFVGWVTLLLALAGLASQKTRIYAVFWALFAAIFGVISLGPTLRINGQEWELPLPFDLLLQIPIVSANRYPSRYSVIIMLCFAILVAWGASALLIALRIEKERTQILIMTGLAALLIFEHMGLPLPLSDYQVPPIYEELKQREGSSLLEVPLAWRNGFRVTGTLHNSFMFAQAFQSTHEKRLLSGNTSRNPEFKFQYFTELPLINSLLALETGHPLPDERLTEDKALAPELLRLLDSPDIVVRQLNLDNPSISPEATLPYLEAILDTTRWHESAGYVGLHTNLPAAPRGYEWDATHRLARLFFAEGWSALPPYDNRLTVKDHDLYAQQEQAHLLLPAIDSPNDWQLTFNSSMPAEVEMPVTIVAAHPAGGGSSPLASLLLRGNEQHVITIPATSARDSLTKLTFYFEGQSLPAELFVTDTYTVGRTSTRLPVSLLVESAGLSVGKMAHIYLNGVDLLADEEIEEAPGYYVALISLDGELLTIRHFNTFNDVNASSAMYNFIQEVPFGTIVALAASDTVSSASHTGGEQLGDEVIAALATLGSTEISDLRGCYACSHAFIGVKGAPTGTILEDSSPIRPARVSLGPALNRNTVFARLGEFRLE